MQSLKQSESRYHRCGPEDETCYIFLNKMIFTCQEDIKSSIPCSCLCKVLICKDCRLFSEGGKGFLLSLSPSLMRMYNITCNPIIVEIKPKYSTHICCLLCWPCLGQSSFHLCPVLTKSLQCNHCQVEALRYLSLSAERNHVASAGIERLQTQKASSTLKDPTETPRRYLRSNVKS